MIVDITQEQLDRVFQYLIPASMHVEAGSQVLVPFGRGNRKIRGYVIECTDQAEWDPAKIKEILEVYPFQKTVETQMIQLAAWMKRCYGSTMIQALKTVLPMQKAVKPIEKKYYVLKQKEEAILALEEAKRKKWKARIRLLEALLESEFLPADLALERLHVTSVVAKPLEAKGILSIVTETAYRNPLHSISLEQKKVQLNEAQSQIVSSICRAFDQGERKPSYIHGITGSGKTEVYMEIIAHVLNQNRQVIVLIPEIALTYQTVMRFYQRFGNQISILNSRLSPGERFDQMERARNGEIQVMIGPRSALFTPFARLGLIVIDEEHEAAYKSEYSPKYHARETAIERARLCDGMVVMGSATPSVEAYYKAKTGKYRLYQLRKRAIEKSQLADVSIVDLREELKQGNRSIFSRQLKEMIEERLERKEQILLFLNRRGYSGFVSCRSCGKSIGCPHCDVSLTSHRDGSLVCHYCGYSIPMPERCPFCGSPYIAGFGLGTQKVEALTAQEFPNAKILRMDLDTTSKKNGHQEILEQFSNGEADILIGTQMIVKGHDFPNVTLVGVLAADLSLYSGDYRSAERTFQLLTQAAGRAGRAEKPGNVIIQTYSPTHYSILAAKNQNYEQFYEQEITYRTMLQYPPKGYMMELLITSDNEIEAENTIHGYAALIQNEYNGTIKVIGPTNALIGKIKDTYRKVLYLKSLKETVLIEAKDRIEQHYHRSFPNGRLRIQFDFYQ